MKIKKLKLHNFAKFTDFECEFDGKVTHLVGANGAGKTTIGLTSVWACLKGIAQKSTNGQLVGDRFRFISNDAKSADVELTLFDAERNAEIVVKNKITDGANKITFHAPPLYPIDQMWLNKLLSVAFMSAKNFTQLSGKDQALLLGIDTYKFDEQIKSLKEDYTIINREFRSFGEIQQLEELEKVSITELLKEKDEIDQFNFEQKEVELKKTNYQEKIKQLRDKRLQLLNELINIDKSIDAGLQIIDDLPQSKPMIDTEIILNKIDNAETINSQADEYLRSQEQIAAKSVKQHELDNNKTQQQEIINQRLEFIKSFNFPLDNISVDETGALMIDNRPFREPYFSKGEIELYTAKLHAAKDPIFKVRFLDDFDLLDESNQEKIVNELLDAGFQVITAEVNDNKTGENVLSIKEGCIK